MKRLRYILAILILGLVGCWDSSVRFERPSHLPKNLPRHWEGYEDRAWRDGRLTYNRDSTVCFITTPGHITPAHAEAAGKREGSLTIQK
jgi:hypothetical protein